MTVSFKISDSRKDKKCSIITFSEDVLNEKDAQGGLHGCFPDYSAPISKSSIKIAKFSAKIACDNLVKKGFIAA